MVEKGVTFNVFLRKGGNQATLYGCEAAYTHLGKRVHRRGKDVNGPPSAQIWKVDCGACPVSATVEVSPKLEIGDALRDLGTELCSGRKRPIRKD